MALDAEIQPMSFFGSHRLLGCRKSAVNSLSNDKIMDWFKLKAFADDKSNVTEKLKLVGGRVENIVG